MGARIKGEDKTQGPIVKLAVKLGFKLGVAPELNDWAQLLLEKTISFSG
jgi:hypothetical protein